MMTTEQWAIFRRAADSSRCQKCRWRAGNAIHGCGYALVLGHTFRIFILEKRLGHRLLPEELSLLLPENCEFYEEQEYGIRCSDLSKSHG